MKDYHSPLAIRLTKCTERNLTQAEDNVLYRQQLDKL